MNWAKARLWLARSETYFVCLSHKLSISRTGVGARSPINEKACGERGRNHNAWKLMLHEPVMEEFDLFRVARVKFTREPVPGIEIDFVQTGNVADIPNIPVTQIVTKYCIHDYCMLHNHVERLRRDHRSNFMIVVSLNICLAA